MNILAPRVAISQFFKGINLLWIMAVIVMASLTAALIWFKTPVSAPMATAADCRDWQDWAVFKQSFISEGGRVVDAESPRKHTVSEGQAYALFFALVANDRPTFNKLLQWTEDNLAQGDLTANLPAWQWGHRDDDSWGVLDNNSASDADCWLAYTLGEAGRLWREPRYTALSALIANRILRMEVVQAAKLGPVLLPGQVGFQPSPNTWRLNPSYLPVFILRRLAADYPESPWQPVLDSSLSILIESAPQGFAPDWVLYQSVGNFSADPSTHGVGSYDAIRVYLWAGMMSAQDPLREKLLNRFSPMAKYVAERGVPPETVDSMSGVASGTGSSGFSAALLPFISAQNNSQALQEQVQRVRARPVHDRPTAYYDHVLALFGQGWYDRHFSFATDGSLMTPWKDLCAVSQ